MATVGQVYYRVMNNNNGGYESNPQNVNIYSDLVSLYGRLFNKIGILAPPGTKVVMNTNKTILIGRTGMYELDDDIAVTNLYFVHPRYYIKDEAASAEAIAEGAAGMKAADDVRTAALNLLKKDFPSIPTDLSDPNYLIYWNRYNEILSTYIEAYLKALGLFNTGVNGIYVLPNPSNLDAPENFLELNNVILDFIYE